MSNLQEQQPVHIIGGIEAGGTKMVYGVADTKGNTLSRVMIPTTTPEETIPQMIEYFKKWKIEALGLGSFGPIDLNEKSPTYGQIMKSPKEAWSGYNIRKAFSDGLGVPVAVDTDVNVAVLGEVKIGAAKGCENALYITVGTGIGVGVYCNGGLVHGLTHPEGGHILITKRPDDSFAGCCSRHANCVEGLASGRAIELRWGKKGHLLKDEALVWEMESDYLAQAIVNYILLYSPQKIVLWGGVMHTASLFPLIRGKVLELLNGYVAHPMLEEHMDSYIVTPGLGENAGLVGAKILAVEKFFSI